MTPAKIIPGCVAGDEVLAVTLRRFGGHTANDAQSPWDLAEAAGVAEAVAAHRSYLGLPHLTLCAQALLLDNHSVNQGSDGTPKHTRSKHTSLWWAQKLVASKRVAEELST